MAKGTGQVGSKTTRGGASQNNSGLSIRLEFVGVIAMAFLAIGLIVGSSFFGTAGKSDAAAFISIGNAAYDAGAPKAAVLAYQRALELSPGNPDVLTDLGTMYLRTNEVDKAIASFKAAGEADPKHSKSRFNLGIALMAAKRYSEAGEAFSQYLSLDPQGENAAAAQAHLKIIQKLMKK